jgi:hypothetical protein
MITISFIQRHGKSTHMLNYNQGVGYIRVRSKDKKLNLNFKFLLFSNFLLPGYNLEELPRIYNFVTFPCSRIKLCFIAFLKLIVLIG